MLKQVLATTLFVGALVAANKDEVKKDDAAVVAPDAKAKHDKKDAKHEDAKHKDAKHDKKGHEAKTPDAGAAVTPAPAAKTPDAGQAATPAPAVEAPAKDAATPAKEVK